jgi:hypothetical protein
VREAGNFAHHLPLRIACRFFPTAGRPVFPASTGASALALADHEMASILLAIPKLSLASGLLQLRLKG